MDSVTLRLYPATIVTGTLAAPPGERLLAEETPSLRLVLQARMTIDGLVTSSRGPVPGARILAKGEMGETGAASGMEAVSGPAGEFTLKLPAGTRNIHLNVVAPGYATRMLKAQTGAGSVLEIPLEPAGGNLVLDFGSETSDWTCPGSVDSFGVGSSFLLFGGPGGQSPPAPESYGNA